MTSEIQQIHDTRRHYNVTLLFLTNGKSECVCIKLLLMEPFTIKSLFVKLMWNKTTTCVSVFLYFFNCWIKETATAVLHYFLRKTRLNIIFKRFS